MVTGDTLYRITQLVGIVALGFIMYQTAKYIHAGPNQIPGYFQEGWPTR